MLNNGLLNPDAAAISKGKEQNLSNNIAYTNESQRRSLVMFNYIVQSWTNTFVTAADLQNAELKLQVQLGDILA